MPLAYSTVGCTELFGSRNESYSIPTVGQSTVTLQCAWNDAISLVGDILDNRRSDPLHAGMFANAATIKAAPTEYSQDGQVLIPAWANVQVTYGTLTLEERESVNAGEDPNAEVISETIEPTIEFMTLNYKNFQWTDTFGPVPAVDLLKPDEAPGRLMPGAKIARSWKRVQSLPTGICNLMGKVNQDPYTSLLLGLTFAAETLLYMPPVLTRTITRTEILAWNVNMSFGYKPQTWNKFWRETTQAYSSIYIKEGATSGPLAEYKNYPTADLSTLLF
jgi:hypothetical protein